jgi:hypothetical protein
LIVDLIFLRILISIVVMEKPVAFQDTELELTKAETNFIVADPVQGIKKWHINPTDIGSIFSQTARVSSCRYFMLVYYKYSRTTCHRERVTIFE